jgi:hypothetical protein
MQSRQLAYDFKIAGVAHTVGRSSEVRHPCRLPARRDAMAANHVSLGYRVQHMELSAELCQFGRRMPFAVP